MLRHLDLFSGIGGFALGLESTGHFQTVAFCEIEDYPRRVLKKHWPKVPCYEDIRGVGTKRLAADGIGRIDIVTGGFPCQDISLAGFRAGLSGERSGLWSELCRVVVEVRPRWVIAENVPGLRTLGADRVLADLAGTGYSAWPLVVGAQHAGAPHRRQRVWIVAHARRFDAHGRQSEQASAEREDPAERHQARVPSGWAGGVCDEGKTEFGDDGRDGHAADSDVSGLAQYTGQRDNARPEQPAVVGGDRQWDWSRAPEPVLRRMDDGLPCGLHRRERLKALGNAVVPQIVAAIGRAIVEVENNLQQPTRITDRQAQR